MAFLDINDVRAKMVLASDVLSQDRRILLRAGVRLTQKHIVALKAMGYLRLEITTARNLYRDSHPDHIEPQPAEVLKPNIPPARIEAVVKTLEVSRPPTEPLQPDPVLLQQTDAILKSLFANNKTKAPAASMAEVLRRATMRIIKESKVDVEVRRQKAKENGISAGMSALISEHIPST
ncbi:MAG: hypothetical protein OEX12_10165 [Gammaproteobacteria bacterium]|nr:hypothetical protein [Gammaproteobacteria bacterium]